MFHLLTDLETSIIPHRDWPLKRWMYANPRRYYHRSGRGHFRPQHPSFYHLLDPEVKDLCSSLHNFGFETTPSCQGHFHQEKWFKNIWDIISKEEKVIQTDGLDVYDSVTQEHCLFYKKDYALPWSHFQDFFSASNTHQQIGYLGVWVPPQLLHWRELFDFLLHSTTESRFVKESHLPTPLGGLFYSFYVTASCEFSRKRCWHELTQQTLAVLGFQAQHKNVSFSTQIMH